MMNAQTGQWLTLTEHINQCIEKIFGTLKGTRIELRDFGSVVPALIDQVPTPTRLMQTRAALVMGIMQWERRLRIERIDLTPAEGGLDIDIQGRVNDQPVQYHYPKVKLTTNPFKATHG